MWSQLASSGPLLQGLIFNVHTYSQREKSCSCSFQKYSPQRMWCDPHCKRSILFMTPSWSRLDVTDTVNAGRWSRYVRDDDDRSCCHSSWLVIHAQTVRIQVNTRPMSSSVYHHLQHEHRKHNTSRVTEEWKPSALCFYRLPPSLPPSPLLKGNTKTIRNNYRHPPSPTLPHSLVLFLSLPKWKPLLWFSILLASCQTLTITPSSILTHAGLLSTQTITLCSFLPLWHDGYSSGWLTPSGPPRKVSG